MSDTTTADRGTLTIPEADHTIPATPRDELDAAIATVSARARDWVARDIPARIALIDRLLEDTLAVAEDWVVASAEAKRIDADSPLMGEAWVYGPVPVLRNLRLLRDTLTDIETTGSPQPPGFSVRPSGQVSAKVFPTGVLDNLLFTGFTAEVRFQPDVTEEQAREGMGRIYRPGGKDRGALALVLGAGNVSSIGPMDVLYKLFAEDRVCILKMNPVNEYLGPHIATAFAALVEDGFLRVVYGGAEEGAYLCAHDDIDEIHITGSDKTHDAIVFGPGSAGAKRKTSNKPLLKKPISSELGNVSPVIVVPGPWSDKDLAFQGMNIASMLVGNAGFNCIAARMIVQHGAWARRRLVDQIRAALTRVAPRHPYYPGALDRWRTFTEAHPEAELFGPAGEGALPFTLIPGIDPAAEDEIAFGTEAFCGVFGEVGLDAARSVPDFLAEAVDFANDRLWGTLSAAIIVHPSSMKNPMVASAVEKAIDDLRYGSVVVNHWSAVPYAMVSTPWGAAPGHELTDIQSGRGVVHNTYLLEDVQKTVARGPFRTPIKPAWFADHKAYDKLGPRLARLEGRGDWKALPGLLAAAVRG